MAAGLTSVVGVAVQRALQAGAHVLVSVAATQMALLPLSGTFLRAGIFQP